MSIWLLLKACANRENQHGPQIITVAKFRNELFAQTFMRDSILGPHIWNFKDLKSPWVDQLRISCDIRYFNDHRLQGDSLKLVSTLKAANVKMTVMAIAYNIFQVNRRYKKRHMRRQSGPLWS